MKSPTISVLVSDLPADHVSVKLRVTEKLCPIDLSSFQIFISIYIYIYILDILDIALRYRYIYIRYSSFLLDIALWHTKLCFHVQIEHSTRMSHCC